MKEFKQKWKGFFLFRIQYRRVSFLIIFLIIALGSLSLYKIPKESSPNISFGMIRITTAYPGANSLDIDNNITRKIERALQNIDNGIKKIHSLSDNGISIVTIELEDNTDSDILITKIKDEIQQEQFPESAKDPIIKEIRASNNMLFEAIFYGSKDVFTIDEIKAKAQIIKDKLEGNYGIQKIDISIPGTSGEHGIPQGGGSLEYEIQVIVDQNKAQRFGQNIQTLAQLIFRYYNDFPLGKHGIGSYEYELRIMGSGKNIYDILKIPIPNTSQNIVLGDIASIQKVYDDDFIQSVVVNNQTGYRSIGMIFSKKKDKNMFLVAKKAKQAINTLLHDPQFQGIHVLYGSDMSEIIYKDYQILGKNAIQTLIFVFFVLLFFVTRKEASIASMTLPLAFFVTFIVLEQAGLSLNFLTNFSLVLSMGIAIDTTIVIIEAASENIKLGYAPKNAILLAIQQYKTPLISGTMTTLIAFLPMMILPGITGKFLAYIPITIFSTLLATLILALTLNSALFYKFSKNLPYYIPDKQRERLFTKEEISMLHKDRKNKKMLSKNQFSWREQIIQKCKDRYAQYINHILTNKNRKLGAIIIPIILLGMSILFLGPKIGATLFPASDNDRIDIIFTLSPNTPTKVASHILPQVEDIFTKFPEIEFARIHVKQNKIFAGLYLYDYTTRKQKGQRDVFLLEQDLQKSLLDFIQKQGSGIRTEIQALTGGPPQGKTIGIKLIAENNQQISDLVRVGNDFVAYLQTQKGIKNAQLSSEQGIGQVIYTMRHEYFQTLGIHPGTIIPDIIDRIQGRYAGTITLGIHDNDIVLYEKLGSQQTNILNAIDNISLSQGSTTIPFSTLFHASLDQATISIAREDGKITLRAEADLESEYSHMGNKIQKSYQERASAYQFPTGISYKNAGEAEENSELIDATLYGLIIAIFGILIILVLQFNSFRKPFIILFSIFCALLGVNVGLFVTGNPYSMSAAIGFIALTGIVVNDAIIFISKIENNRKQGSDMYTSIVEAGKSRLQAIVLTTLTTIAGILPISFQDAFWSGLGFTLIFGLFTGSLLTLFSLPGLYALIHTENKENTGKGFQKTEA